MNELAAALLNAVIARIEAIHGTGWPTGSVVKGLRKDAKEHPDMIPGAVQEALDKCGLRLVAIATTGASPQVLELHPELIDPHQLLPIPGKPLDEVPASEPGGTATLPPSRLEEAINKGRFNH